MHNQIVKVPDDVDIDPESPDDWGWLAIVRKIFYLPNEITGDLQPSLIVQEIVEIIFYYILKYQITIICDFYNIWEPGLNTYWIYVINTNINWLHMSYHIHLIHVYHYSRLYQ